MDLNIPETRQDVLTARLDAGAQIVAADVAAEFGVSVDTVRRDIIALELAGKAQRVRGGAVPMAKPSGPFSERLRGGNKAHGAIADAALRRLDGCSTLFLDGGSTVYCVAERLRPAQDLLVFTPSPWVAIACQKNGVEVFMLGGRLSARGGINVGDETGARIAELAADVAVLGACGLEADHGLSSDDFEEAKLKRAMADSAARTFVLTDKSKIGRRARHRTVPPAGIDLVITDMDRPRKDAFADQGVEVEYV